MHIITDNGYLLGNDEFDCCQFEKLNITDSFLASKRFFSTLFVDCDLSNCDFSESIFRGCKFINCNLSLINLINVNFSDVTFLNCKLVGVDWTVIDWRKQPPKRGKRIRFPISFDNCILDYSTFIGLDLYYVLFNDSMLREVSFADANLEYAKFINTDLTGSIFRDTILGQADFTTAINYTIDACNNSMRGAKFSLPEAINLVYALEIEIV